MAKTQLLINYVPGDECRVAVVEDGKLEEFHAEKMSAVSRVGNIYVGTVTNVEAAIQAAFVDFGTEQHGFLHVTDLHPMHFPGEDEETTERVGKKTPRRDRPPIQRCLKRGQQIVVQVLKEGVGTKGPTLTGYLSIPGRYLVMMPQMDRVGVSRKVEDEDQRRKMRQVLDQLDLPDGFGFILRTAGFDRTKTDLKRDLAYLQRLWRDMEKRRKTGRKHCLLYSESDLLVRTIRDRLTSDINEVVLDNEQALVRASRFLKIVAPRSQVKLLHYAEQTPLFHAFGIEQQIAMMHAREVPLPSGGRLVIDETEALVAIDVNSGRSRSARDAETNAFRTNLEAADEICRQLRLRDLGGLVINDLIDMRDTRHRRKIEAAFRERLKRDRARSTILPISSFGILEMTRQRMRGSHESMHFAGCPTCRGRGLVQRPDSLAADALRNLAALLDHDRIDKVEMVVAPRVASELLSHRRRSLNMLERTSGRHVDVRVSETVPIDRVAFYAYDAEGADVDVEKLANNNKSPKVRAWSVEKTDEDWAVDPNEEAAAFELEELEALDADEPIDDLPGEQVEEPTGKKRRRRRRRRRRKSGEESAETETAAGADETPAEEASNEPAAEADTEQPKKKRSRRRRRKRASQAETGETTADTPAETSADPPADTIEPADGDVDSSTDEDESKAPKKKTKRKRRRSRRKKTTTTDTEATEEDRTEDDPPPQEATDPPKKKRKRRSRKKANASETENEESPSESTEPSETEPGTKKKRKRTTRRKKVAANEDVDSSANGHAEADKPAPRRLYASRRKLTPSERAQRRE